MSQGTRSFSPGLEQSIASPDASTSLYSFVFEGQDFSIRMSTPAPLGDATWASSSLRYLVTNGSASSTITIRRFEKKGSVRSSSSTSASEVAFPSNRLTAISSASSPSTRRLMAWID